jgi:hypothetical protein
MTLHTLGLEHVPLLERLKAVLEGEESAVKRQIGIELLSVRHCCQVGNRADALRVAEGIHKHVRQMIEQTLA